MLIGIFVQKRIFLIPLNKKRKKYIFILIRTDTHMTIAVLYIYSIYIYCNIHTKKKRIRRNEM